MPSLAEFNVTGFAVLSEFLSHGELIELEPVLPQAPHDGGVRNLLDIAAIVRLAESQLVRRTIESILGPNAFAVRAILFDKTSAANWKVSWHQDLTIAVTQRSETPGYGPWSEKAGVVHVQPPLEVLECMVALRLHVDESGPRNGPLRVLPGSHKAGKLRDAEISTWRNRIEEAVCVVPRGGALLMRPLLLHASSPAEDPAHRRVIHIEFAKCVLEGGLRWRWGRLNARAA